MTAWIEALGPATVQGPRSAQTTLHQALPVDSLVVGPALFDVTGVANAVLYVRVDPVPGQVAGFDGVAIKTSTSIAPVKPGATVLIAYGAKSGGTAAEKTTVDRVHRSDSGLVVHEPPLPRATVTDRARGLPNEEGRA